MVLDLLFGFSGRINRAKYWLASFIQAAFIVSVCIILVLVTIATDRVTAQVMALSATEIALLIAAVSHLAVMVKRAHDCGHTAFYLLLLFLPLVCILPMIQLPFGRGSVGPNRYGPDPLARHDIRKYSEDIARNPQKASAFVARGSTRAMIGEYDDAIADLDAAITLNPRDAEAFNGRAFVHFRRGQWERAIADYGRAIALNARNAEALFGRGAARLRINDPDGNGDIAAATAIDPAIAKQMALIAVAA